MSHLLSYPFTLVSSKSSTYNLCDLEESWVLNFLDWCFPWHFQLAKGATQGGSSSTASPTSLCSQ